jgi:hypothetical protein
VSPRPHDLTKIIHEAANTMQPLLDKYGQRLVLDLPAILPLVMVDPRRTGQVLVNLLANASKYGPADADITIQVNIEDSWVRVNVSDRGPGVPEEYRETCFNVSSPSFEQHRSKRRIGLGLSVVGRWSRQGGQPGWCDRQGGGSLSGLLPGAGQLKALIVDDDRVLADVVALHSARLPGYRAYDGLSACNAWRKIADLIVLDVNLPKMDGFTVCQRIRRRHTDYHAHGAWRGRHRPRVETRRRRLHLNLARQLVARPAVLRRAGQSTTPRHDRLANDLAASRRDAPSEKGRSPDCPQGRLWNCLMVSAGRVLTIDTLSITSGDLAGTRYVTPNVRH